MNKINYSQIYAKLTKGLSPKTKDIFERRFGVKTGKVETLESIGKRLGITRERVRQIEEVGFNFVKKNHKETLAQIYKEFKDYFYFWSTMQDPENTVAGTLNSLVSDLKTHGNLLTKEELTAKFASNYNLNNQALDSYLEVSKRIQANKDGKLGLIDWPEIRPRSVRDKAFLVFKKHQKPLHFRDITSLIDQLNISPQNKKTHVQTVHNELIKDQRFVLVGRGMYALGEWGYK